MAAATLASVRRPVARCVARRPEIKAAYIFGSVAEGRARADSDVDVAVLVDETIRPSRMLQYRLELMADLGAALHRRDVEVVVLNEAPPLLAHRVLSRGTLVFERSRSARVRFQVRTAARYQDLIPMYETHIRYLKARARRQRPPGARSAPKRDRPTRQGLGASQRDTKGKEPLSG